MKMGLALFLVLIAVSAGFADDLCPGQSLVAFYKEIGCVAKDNYGLNCPTSFDCSAHENRNANSCYFRGRTYVIGETVLTSGSYFAVCRCINSDGKPAFNCVHVECASEAFRSRPEQNCRKVYEHTSTCSTGTICGPSETTCDYRNKTYHLGEKFYPIDEPCKTCICMDNFKGVIKEPFCIQRQCNVQLKSWPKINQGCAPVYNAEGACCPNEWKCPHQSDSVRETHTVKTPEVCKFGSLVLQIGDELQHSRQETIQCNCKLPPFVTCIQKHYRDFSSRSSQLL